MEKNMFKDEYLPYINKWGQITNILGIVLSFGPALVVALIYNIMPPISAIITGFIAIAGAIGVMWFIEPLSYFPIVGVAGTYMAFLSGNISNMRIPCAAIAQKAAGVEPGTDEGAIVSTLGMAVSIFVNTTILTLGVLAGSAILSRLPDSIVAMLNLLLPSLFGAIFVQFALKKLKMAPFALFIALGLTLAMNAGWFSFLPGTPSYVVTLGSVFGTILIASYLYKKKKI